jgi:ribosomal 50S subunit-recycling heat shock protein
MLGVIERRLDNVVYRMGFAASRIQGRQLVRHGHVLVNGKRVDIPSFRVKPADTIAIRETSKKIGFIAAALASAETRPRPSWLDVDKDALSGVFRSMPVRDEMNEPMVRELYVVEYYSRCESPFSGLGPRKHTREKHQNHFNRQEVGRALQPTPKASPAGPQRFLPILDFVLGA